MIVILANVQVNASDRLVPAHGAGCHGRSLMMRLRNLVILLTTFQALFDITGIIVTIFCPPCRGVLQLDDLTYDRYAKQVKLVITKPHFFFLI